MARINVVLSQNCIENISRVQSELLEKYGGARVAMGFAIGYCVEEYLRLRDAYETADGVEKPKHEGDSIKSRSE